MKLQFRTIFLLFTPLLLTISPARTYAVDKESLGGDAVSVELPDAPVPQIEFVKYELPDKRTFRSDDEQPVVKQAEAQKTEKQKADEQLDTQVHQRALGILPMFNITYLGDQTVSMTTKQKFALAARSTIDPVAFIIPFVVAGVHEVLNDQEGFDWGVKGLGERAGAAYLDTVTGSFIGNALLPSILHQDPRYYRRGYGSTRHRLLYALATSVICKHDNTGKWEPNYSNIGGNIAAGAVSTLYYPSNEESGVGLMIGNGLVVTATGAAGALFNEFWPDISRKAFHRDPSRGLDAQRQAAHEAEKKGAADSR